ncbi:AraC-like DNA-binding protein [Kineosphaera limosa]|nr:AraC family transcriptional regulator [Kineosphaera limosa]NYE00200.1 AraC-like DNA-binding protein [Kineosphaera limosa]
MNVDRTRMPVRSRLRSRGVPTVLQGHEVLCTTDIVEAAETISEFFGHTRIATTQQARADFQATFNALRFVDVTMAYLDFRGPARMSVPQASDDAFTVHMTTAGTASVSLDGREHPITAFFALVVSPGTGYTLRLGADSPQLVIRIERPALERQLSRMLGKSLDAPVVFEPLGDLTTDEAVRWHGALQLLSSEVISPNSLTQQGIGADAIEELLVSTLLYLQGSNYTTLVRTQHRRSGRAAVRRSVEYIEMHLAEPITLADLVEASGMSARSIQAGFREDLGTTPVGYIRDRRLDRVRAELMQALPGDGVTVTAIAEQWGFGHLGGFAALYKRRFGEPPSQTLRR